MAFLLFSLSILVSCENSMSTSNKPRETMTHATYSPEDVTIDNLHSRPKTQPGSPTVITDGEISTTISQEARLKHFLMKKYKLVGKGSRPVLNHSHTVEVYCSLNLLKMDLDEKAQILVTTMWTYYKWRDMHLVWNPKEYGGIMRVKIDPKHIWLPDIILANTATTEVLMDQTLTEVENKGSVHWTPSQIFKSSCATNVEDYPFDRQKCFLMYGPRNHYAHEVNISMDSDGIYLGMYRPAFKKSCEWTIIKQDYEKQLMHRADIDVYFAVMSCWLHLERKITFTTYILTLPCVFLAVLTLVVFWLPVGNTDRTGLAMSLFASFLVLLLILVEAAPPTPSSIPKLGIYYCFNMVLVILPIFLSSLVVNVHKAGENKKQVPAWLRVITTNLLAKAFRLDCKKGHGNKIPSNMNRSTPLEEDNEYKDMDQNEPSDKLKGEYDQSNLITVNQEEKDSHTSNRMLKELHEVRRILEFIVEKRAEKNKAEGELKYILSEWNLVATCLDGLFFFVYLICIIMSLVFLFPKPA